VNLDSDETKTAYNCVSAVMRGFVTNAPPWAVQQLYDRLNAERRNPSQFRSEHECCCDGEQSKQENLLSSRQVATMLGYSKQHVNRKFTKLLGAVDVDGAWVFPESAVLEHLDGRDA
jgi:hypothetical protein